MRSRIPAAVSVPTTDDDRREPSLAKQSPSSVARLATEGPLSAKPLRAGERIAVLSSSGGPAEPREGMGLLTKLGIGILFVLALVGVFSLVRYFAGL